MRNAFEHALDGQGPITIRIKEHELLITNLVSSDADEQRTAARTASHGNGLGLAIVQRLCERYHWHLMVTSAPGRGTEVAIRFS